MPRVPYVGFGNDEIEAAPPISNSVECCPHCGREHEIKTAESESGFRIHVYTCPDTRSTYLAGVQGKRLGTPSVHGSVNMDDEPASPRDALAAVLLFYSAGHWTEEKREQWKRITGSDEATTKVLCDTVRRTLVAMMESPDAAE